MAQFYRRKYGEAATINFVVFEIDGVDLRTDATIGTADLDVMKDEGAEAAASNAATDEGQGYSLVLTATEMTAKRITIYVVDAATKVWLDDVLIIETENHPDAQHPNGITEAGTAQAGANSTITLRSTAIATNDIYLGQMITITGGTGVGASKPVTLYVGSTKVATVSGTWATNPDSTSLYEIRGDSVTEISVPTVGEITNDILDEDLTSHTTTDSTAAQIKDILLDTASMEGRLPTTLSTAGNIKSSMREYIDGAFKAAAGTEDDPYGPA